MIEGSNTKSAESPTQPVPNEYIIDNGESVSYLGVEVQKGDGGPLVPEKHESVNYFYTEEDHILRREVATSLALNKPLLIEGGTGIGKTSTIAAMCADLNMNYCKVSFGREMAIEDIIGGKTITTDDNGNEMVKWYDGNLLVAIRSGGVAFLDEYNMQGSKIGSRVNPIIDAVLNGRREIFLPENDNERVEVHPSFRIIAAQNPPGTEEGQEFTGRDILSAESFGRWTFHKMPLDMSKEMRNKRMAGMMGESVTVDVPESDFHYLGEGIPLRELKDIPGMTHWRRESIEIIDMLKAKSTGAGREMARDQRQKIYFNPRLEQGLLNYVSKFYRGDVNQVWKNAFEHLIVGMYKTHADRQRVREVLNQASFVPQTESKRKGLDEEGSTSESEVTTSIESAELKEVQEVFGDDFIGLIDTEKFTGVTLTGDEKNKAIAQLQEKIRVQGITKEVLEREKQEGFMVIRREGYMVIDGEKVPVTCSNLKKAFPGEFWSQDWYTEAKEQEWWNKPIQPDWSIVKKEVLEESCSQDWDKQEKVLKKWAQEHHAEGFTKRRKPEEVIYDILLNYKVRDRRILERDYDWTSVQSSSGNFVGVGYFDSGGLFVYRDSRGNSSSNLGVCPSR